MKTAVIQSASPRRPAWIATCLESVKNWAEPQFDYFFEGDALFDRIDPAHQRALLQHSDKAPLSDLGRLLWAKELLGRSYERVIWLDSDVYIFDPTTFTSELPADTAFCQETWFAWRLIGFNQYRFAVNNAVMVLCDSPDFHRYLTRAIERIESGGSIKRLSIGPDLLSLLHYEQPLRLIRNVPTLPHPVQRSFLDDGSICRDMMKCQGHTAAAVHLCSSQAKDAEQLASDTIAAVRVDHGHRLNKDVTPLSATYFDGMKPYSQIKRSGRVLFSFASWIRSFKGG